MSKLSDLTKELKSSDSYWESLVKTEVANQVLALLQDLNLNQSLLAQALDVSPAYVSRITSAKENLSVKTLTKLAHVLNKRLKIDLVDDGCARYQASSSVKWNDLLTVLADRDRTVSEDPPPYRYITQNGWRTASNQVMRFDSKSHEALAA